MDEVTEEQFKEEVVFFLATNDKGDFLLAKEFEIAVTTVHRWVSGVARPHPGVRRQVVRWINDAGVV